MENTNGYLRSCFPFDLSRGRNVSMYYNDLRTPQGILASPCCQGGSTGSVSGVFEAISCLVFYGKQERRWLRSSLRQNGFVIGKVPIRGGLGFKY